MACLPIPDLAVDAGDLARAPRLAQERFVACSAHPLLAKGQVRDVLEILHRGPLDPDEQWREFLAAQAAIAPDNAVLFPDLQPSLEAQRAAQAQWVPAVRLAAVGELVAGVAYQINSPLTAQQLEEIWTSLLLDARGALPGGGQAVSRSSRGWGRMGRRWKWP